MQTLAHRFSLCLEAKGLSRRELSRLSEIHVNTLNKWASGESTNPNEGHLRKVASILGVTYEWIRTGEGPMITSPLSDVSFETFKGVAETQDSYSVPTNLDAALLEQVIREALTIAPNELPEHLAKVISEVYGIALRTRRLDRVQELVKMLLS